MDSSVTSAESSKPHSPDSNLVVESLDSSLLESRLSFRPTLVTLLVPMSSLWGTANATWLVLLIVDCL